MVAAVAGGVPVKGPPLANDAVVSGGPDTLETGPPWQSISTSRCACPYAMLASPFTGGPSWQAPLCSQSKLQNGRGPGCCCGAAPLYLGPGQSYRRGVGVAAAVATMLYRRRHCSVVRTVSYDNNEYHFTAAENTGYHSRGRRCNRYMTKLFAAAATVLYHRRRCSVARTVWHDSNGYHCTAAENTGYHSRGRRCDRCMTEAI